MKSHCVLANDSMVALNLKGDISQSFQEKHTLGLWHLKLKATHSVNYFPGFLGKHV